ncbi:phosphate acyltransferase PlsX [Thermanaeromonas sp. C210]|uniref:phosphate acyltransferase PlsX n=1 Tax=Thermanaeromonas sp. C210 TaxID=2731925 RepID=UPI00155CD6C9|nr:phosphate acyltransferase PlsX [Thermanaeromonas sp. C210]GFN23975.1 phosphate acyltransferase [Thermanaeromonas sp. C210]
MKIAVDAMGGDHAPGAVVRGAVAAAREGWAEVILVGDSRAIEKELEHGPPGGKVEIVHTDQVITMDEQPALAVRRKKEASIVLATRLVREGRAQAVVSAGSTGAQMAAALLILGRSGNIQRPAIATFLPTLEGPKLLLDAGANVDCRPDHLYEFAQMGSLYAHKILGVPSPRVGLINVGVEAGKGNELVLQTYELLRNSSLNFVGNVESRDLPRGVADVYVCDGFTGNVLLKFGEGLALSIFAKIQEEVRRNFRARLGAALMLPALRRLKQEVDYAEYGGAPLLGVQGISIICHGSSDERAIKNAIKVAVRCIQEKLVENLGHLPGLNSRKKVENCQLKADMPVS